jgi:hypothetical protein
METNGIIINHLKLKEWEQNYEDNKNLPFITDSAFISLTQLENFIAEAKEKYRSSSFNALKICFVRYKLTASIDNLILKEVNRDVSQHSFVLVPIKNADPITWTGEDFTFNDGTIFVLPFCNPETPPNKDETGLCPPKRGCKT